MIGQIVLSKIVLTAQSKLGGISTTDSKGWRFVVTLAWLVLAAFGCSTSQTKVLPNAVVRFHSQLDAEQYAQIYHATDSEFQRKVTESEFTRFLRDVHQKLGNTKQLTQVSYSIDTQLGVGTFVVLPYETQFAYERVTEKFTWRIVGDKATLLRFDIESD